MLAIVPFYLLMREAVQRPAALFATAIFASLKVMADTSTHFQVPTLAIIVMVWTMLRAFNTGNAVWLVIAGTLAGVMSYEYETFKAVPIFAGLYIGFIVVRALVWPLPRSLTSWRDRVAGLAPRAAVAAIVLVVAFWIAMGPLMAERHRTTNIYFASLDRQELDRDARGTPGLFSPDSGRQIKWALQAFTPWVEPDYVILGSVPTRGVIDKITSALIWVSLAAAALTFWRGSRALFAGWFVGGILISGLLLSNFEPWKVAGFTLPAIVLTGFLADDLFKLFGRFKTTGVVALSAILAGVALAVLSLNLRAMNANANDENVRREWSNGGAQLFAICDHLRQRPDDNFSLVSQAAKPGWGFNRSPGTPNDPIAVWGDFSFVCWDLRGQQISDLQDAWPWFTDDRRPISILAMDNPDELKVSMPALQRAMPELGEPTHSELSPGGVFQIVSFDVRSDVMNARRGLNRIVDGGVPEVAPAPTFQLPGGDEVVLSGLV
jgi:hypothetical protein